MPTKIQNFKIRRKVTCTKLDHSKVIFQVDTQILFDLLICAKFMYSSNSNIIFVMFGFSMFIPAMIELFIVTITTIFTFLQTQFVVPSEFYLIFVFKVKNIKYKKRTKFALREKYPNAFFSCSPYSVRRWENADQKKLSYLNTFCKVFVMHFVTEHATKYII